VRDLLGGGHAGESPYRHDPGARLSLTLGYPGVPLRYTRYPWWLPPRDRCAWSPEIVRERAREVERCRQVLATIDAAKARMRYGETMADAIHALIEWVDSEDQPWRR